MTPEKLDELERLADEFGHPVITHGPLRDLIAAARREAALREAIRVYLARQYPRGTGHPADWSAAELERALLSEVPQ